MEENSKSKEEEEDKEEDGEREENCKSQEEEEEDGEGEGEEKGIWDKAPPLHSTFKYVPYFYSTSQFLNRFGSECMATIGVTDIDHVS